jgi:methylated-DNA-[protein]-cysteine S-methyltransferase
MSRFSVPYDSPIGHMWVTMSRAGLVSISRGDVPPADAVLDPDSAPDVLDELAAYFGGRLRAFTVRLDLSDATAFDADVWTAARSIPYGRTASYGELAVMASRPAAARAVGGSMARCPFSPVVPCHRVIHANGSLGGWGSESWVKRWLLDLERSGG